jgi:hypothetical protein
MISSRNFMIKKDGTPYKDCLCRTPELIENYDKAIADTNQIWECHHRLETHTSDGKRRLVDLSHKELIALDMYYDRPPEELIFLTHAEHAIFHQKGKPSWNKGKHHSEETKAKIGAARKGMRHSEESKAKMSASHKGKPTWNKGKHRKLVDGKQVYY